MRGRGTRGGKLWLQRNSRRVGFVVVTRTSACTNEHSSCQGLNEKEKERDRIAEPSAFEGGNGEER